MTEIRNSYLVSRALKTFMFASVLASVAQRLATMTDAIVVSNLIGPDAISAINVVTPIITLFPTISILFGIGGSVLAAKAIGRRDAEEANHVFTTALIASFISSILLTIILFLLTPQIVALVCPRNSRLFDMAVSFMHIMSLSAVPTIMGFTLQSFVKTDGNPRLVMVAVISSTALNLVLDVVFIKYFGMGIAGSAWGTIICFIFSISICLIHFRSMRSSFHLHFAGKWMGKDVMRCIAEGFPMSINTLLMGICIFAFNSIVMRSLGEDGMYVWSVCLQLLMLVQLMLGGVSSSIYSIGGLLIGERDMIGLTILIRRVLTYVGIALLVLWLIVEVWPEAFGNLFAGGNSGVADMLHKALRIFSLILLPYALIAILNALYQIIGYRTASIFISIAQLVMMVVFVWLFVQINPSLLWWGYPASAIVLVTVVLVFTWFMHIRKPEIAAVTLIPQVAEAKALNFSIRLTEGDVVNALSQIFSFLQDCNIPKQTTNKVLLCCEELLYNIVRYAVKKHPNRHFIDIHIRSTEPMVSVLLKDDGRPFNPTLRDTPNGIEHLGLRLVNGVSSQINYKYMYDQNMVYMTFYNNQ
ncbi:MAG: ATP-binding protein [Prevotella sp.]|nr:ATP-binding protein [Prevotella sp.]